MKRINASALKHGELDYELSSYIEEKCYEKDYIDAEVTKIEKIGIPL